MFLESLKLENFRNISNLELSFNKKINIFIGNNAQGKTNILESIYFLAITRSHRTNNDTNLIKKDCLYTKVSGVYKTSYENFNYLSILLNEKGKKVSINNIVQKKISNYLSKLNVIMFCPDDLDIVKGSPGIRRRFLNLEISQFRRDYLLLLKEYNQILKQRNEYLKQKNNAQFDKTYFDIITDKLIDKNIEIVTLRYAFISDVNDYIGKIFSSIAETGNLTIKYKSFISEKDLLNQNLKDHLKRKYKSLLMNELLQKTTLLGCHKDDFKLYLNGNDVTEFCSQGQQRLAVFSLKLAELEVFIKSRQIYPIILLDDIFSELDNVKKNNIIKHFNDEVQIFITTTEINDINDELKRKADIFSVSNGNVTKEE